MPQARLVGDELVEDMGGGELVRLRQHGGLSLGWSWSVDFGACLGVHDRVLSCGVVEWRDRSRASGEVERSASPAALDVRNGSVERIELDQRVGWPARPRREVPVHRVGPREGFY